MRRFLERLAGAVELLVTGRVPETFDDVERINQVMWEMGFADRDEASTFVADELNRLWDEAYPAPEAYWDEPEYHYHELSHLAFREAHLAEYPNGYLARFLEGAE